MARLDDPRVECLQNFMTRAVTHDIERLYQNEKLIRNGTKGMHIHKYYIIEIFYEKYIVFFFSVQVLRNIEDVPSYRWSF